MALGRPTSGSPTSPASPGGPARRATAAFTLLELMVVMALLGLLLTMLPPRFDSFGDRSRLESTASTLVSVMTAAREIAIIDGHETRVQFDLPGDKNARTKTGRFRYLVTSLEKQKSKALEDENAPAATRARDEQAEDEWIETEWRSLPDGVTLSGFSVEPGHWIKANPRGDPLEVSFDAEGAIRPACALQLTSVEMPENSDRTLTVLVNALTSAAEIVEGEADLPKDRDSSDFR